MASPAPMETKADRRVFGLDFIRALAITAVLLSHFVGAAEPLGVMGVELFFVLSGFLVGGIFLKIATDKGNVTFGDIAKFWKRRWWRTLPNYFLFLAFFAVMAWFSGTIPPPPQFLSYLVFLQNWLWRPFEFFAVSWSLSVEEWFYLLLPLFVVAAGHFIRPARHAFLVGCLLMGGLSCGLRVTYFNDIDWDVSSRKICLGRMDALMWGCLIAYLKQFKPLRFESMSRPKYFIPAALATLICTVLVFMAYPDKKMMVAPSWLLSAIPACTAALLPAFYKFNIRSGAARNVITKISLWSYSLYLIHTPLLVIGRGWFTISDSTSSRLLVKTACLLMSFLGAALIYRFFEVPMTKMRPAQ
jgi:peptidoglycan/LPS O-acetylase OafA/YrhL